MVLLKERLESILLVLLKERLESIGNAERVA